MLSLQNIGYVFKNTDLFTQSVTHKSFHNENSEKSIGHNERLEFLGDAVLDLALTDQLMALFPNMPEGELSKLRASLVNENTLAEVAVELQLDKDLLFGKGEKLSGGALKPRLLACGFEALLGAIYRDSDYLSVAEIINKIFTSRLKQLDLNEHFKSDYKTRLQEKLQSQQKLTPTYVVENEIGPEHEKVFEVSLRVGAEVLSMGTGKSKKQAEQHAAQRALEIL